jgi:hypothetical protein
MSQFRLIVDWQDSAPEGQAFGPERLTWGRLEMRLDDATLTSNHPSDWRDEDQPFVVGGMSGIAEWIVENWLYLLWETHCPFPKPAASPGQEVHVPTLRDAASGWSQFPAVDGGDMARWQHRHTLGHASSDVALPSIVLLPEEREVGIVLDHIATQLVPNVRFSPPPSTKWPAEPAWCSKDDLTAALESFVGEVIQRCSRSADGAHWAGWMKKEFSAKREEARDDNRRRHMLLGDFVAQRWMDLLGQVNGGIEALQGVLGDSELVSDARTLDDLTRAVLQLQSSARGSARWKEVPIDKINRHLRPYDRGYALAGLTRELLRYPDEPLEMHFVLDKLGVAVEEIPVDVFRSAVVQRDDSATLLWSKKLHHGGLAAVRFSQAAALGRLLSRRGSCFGAAHGTQSRWKETQQANAFAAELLLPRAALEKQEDIQTICEQHGISRSAAEWHRHNRLHDSQSAVG